MSNGWMTIGIWKVSDNKEPPTHTFFTQHTSGYGLSVSSATLIDPNTGYSQWKEYGTKTKTGDKVEMILDIDQQTLKYIINGHDYGFAYDNIEKRKYRAALYNANYNDSITVS